MRAGDYRAAAGKLQRSYRARPRARTLFLWAEAERLGGNCEDAVRLYRRYLARFPRAPHARGAKRGVNACEDAATADVVEDRTEPPADEPSDEPDSRASTTTPDVDMPTNEDENRAPMTRRGVDKLGAILVAGGVVTLAAGAGYYSAADDAANDLPEGATHDMVTSAEGTADRRRMVGAVAMVAGATAVTLGAFRIHIARRDARHRVAVQPFATQTTAGISLSGRF